MNWMFYSNNLNTLYKNKFCVSWGVVSLDHIFFTRNLAFNKSCKTVAGRHAQNKTLDKITCIVPKMLCSIVIRMLNSSKNKLFQRKLLLQTESCTVQSVEVYFQSSLIAIFIYVYKEGLVFWVTFLSLGMELLSNLRAPIRLVWDKQEIESESMCLAPCCHCPNKLLQSSWSFVTHDALTLNRWHLRSRCKIQIWHSFCSS